jgi:hypothetical protein
MRPAIGALFHFICNRITAYHAMADFKITESTIFHFGAVKLHITVWTSAW